MFIEYIPKISQALSTIVSLIYILKYRSKFVYLLLFLLTVTLTLETSSHFFSHDYKEVILFMYHVFTYLVFTIILLMYYQVMRDKVWIWISLVLYLVFTCFFVYGLINGFNNSSLPSLMKIGSLIVSLTLFFYFRSLLLSNDILNYKKELPFWISVGFAVFYMPSVSFFVLLEYNNSYQFRYVIIYLTVLMNLFISYGLIFSTKKNYDILK